MTCTALVLAREPWAVDDPILDTAIFIVDMMRYREEEMAAVVSDRELEDLRDALALAEGRLALLIKTVEEHVLPACNTTAPIGGLRSQAIRAALRKAQGH